MTSLTSVNSQVTDGVTQTGTKVIAEAPAMAMGNLYQAAAHSVGIAFENAVSMQQQSGILAQAATTQGVMQIYTIDTINSAAAGENIAALAPKTLAAVAMPGAASDQATSQVAGAAGNSVHGLVSDAIEHAIEFTNKATIGNAEAWAHACRDVAEAVAAALDALTRTQNAANMEIIKRAAVAAALAQVIKAPDQFEQYQKIIELIKGL